MNQGYATLFRWRGVPIRFHWSVPLGALLLGGFRFDPAFWLGFVVLVLVHEFGHALVVRACRQRVLSIDVHGVGGLCRWAGTVTPMQRAAIAWGGVWAQLVLCLATVLFGALHGPPETPFGASLEDVFVSRNILLAAINLLPFAPLDGAEAWALPMLLFRRARRSLHERRFTRAIRPSAASVKLRVIAQNAEADDPALREEILRLEQIEARGGDVGPEVDQLLGRIQGLGSVDDPPVPRAKVPAGRKSN